MSKNCGKTHLLTILLGILLWITPALGIAQNQYFSFFLGQVHVGRSQADSQYGASWLSSFEWTQWQLQPEFGVIRTRYGSHLAYAGFQRRTYFTKKSNGFALSIGLAPAFYWFGDGGDTDLGSLLQFKSKIGIEYEFPDATRFGASLAHISNASLSETNPGTELWTLHYALPF